jgi:hypothetical protein
LVASIWKGQSYLKTVRASAVACTLLAATPVGLCSSWLSRLFAKRGGVQRHQLFCLKNAFIGEAGKQRIDPSLVQVSYGDLSLPSNIKMKRSGDYLIQFTWDK